MENANEGDMAKQECLHNKTQPTHILSLPIDILLSIFDHLCDNSGIGDHIRLDDDEIKTVQSARLVCSRFNRLASPLLCPILKVTLDQTSLDRACEISKKPLIAAGVRSIDVMLDYRPKELADDLSRYKNQRKEDLDEMRHGCASLTELWFVPGYLSNDEMTRYNKAMEDYRAIASAWDDYCCQPDVAAMDDDTLRYQEILWRGHEEYRLKHEEQFNLIMDGSFVESLALAISRMQHCSSIHIGDEMSDSYYNDPYSDDPTLISTNPEELPRLMVAPLGWRTIEELKGGAGLLPAKIHSELPIAIHKAGTILPVINLSCFPTTNIHSIIHPGHDPNNPIWSGLCSASQNLTGFQFSVNYNLIRDRHILPEEQESIDEYFCSILSGQKIEDVYLNFKTFEFHNSGEAQGMYCIDNIIATASWLRIKRCCILYVSLHQGQLEDFFRRLDVSRMKELRLCNVELLDGSWAGVLDILREKVASRCLNGKCEVQFSDLTGGGYGKWEVKTYTSMESYLELYKEKKSIFARAENYVKGAELQNPLRG